eukprot:3650049-Rhodomonas_salina.1
MGYGVQLCGTEMGYGVQLSRGDTFELDCFYEVAAPFRPTPLLYPVRLRARASGSRSPSSARHGPHEHRMDMCSEPPQNPLNYHPGPPRTNAGGGRV